MKIFIANVNDIMTVDETLIETSEYERRQSNVWAKPEKVLKSYYPEDNVLWSPNERNRRFNEFYQSNNGMIGKGDTILMLSDEGYLIEYYSGIQVFPIRSRHREVVGSNLGDAEYYSVNADADETKLYIPKDCLREVDQEKALSVIETMFLDKKRDVETQIIKPLQKRLISVQKKASYTMDKESNYIDEESISHSR